MLTLAAVLAGTAAATARADGDPASDVLLTDNVFLSYQSPYGSAEGRALEALTKDAKQQGFPIRVAVITQIADLGAVFAAGVLSSLAPPSKALAQLGHVNARVGPGRVSHVMRHGPYRLAFDIDPNRAAPPNTIGVKITRSGKPVTGAGVVARFDMLDMTMSQLAYRLPERAPGTFERSAPALVMVGHWAVDFEIRPPGESPFDVLLVDHATG